MNIIVENNQVIIDLTEPEFSAFSAMFANLGINHWIIIEGLDWPSGSPFGAKFKRNILPLHLCRTIGEACAVEQAGPLDLLSLYPFWKYGFCFSDESDLKLEFTEIDPHKKANLADEFGMGATAWAMEELFHCEAWCDTSDALLQWEVEQVGSRMPDFVCLFADGSFGVFEAKGTTGTVGTAKSQTEDGKEQTVCIQPKSGTISVRCACGISLAKTGSTLILRDPPSTPFGDRPSNSNGSRKNRSLSGAETNVTVDLTPEAIIRGAEARRFRENMLGDISAMFRCNNKALELVRKPFVKDKRHGWLEIG